MATMGTVRPMPIKRLRPRNEIRDVLPCVHFCLPPAHTLGECSRLDFTGAFKLPFNSLPRSVCILFYYSPLG